MANDNQTQLNRDELLSLLARKMGTHKRNVDFLFGKKPTDDKSVEIPDFRATLRNKL